MPRKKKEVEETTKTYVDEVEVKVTPKVSKETTWEFEQDGVMWRKTYNTKGDVIKTEQV